MPAGPAGAKSALAFGFAAVVLAGGARAESAGTSASLQWVRLPGGEECIGSQELARSVEQRLGQPVFASAARAQLAVEGHVAPVEGGYAATLSVSRADGSILGTRELGPVETCRELDEPLAVVVALLLDPEGGVVEPEPPPPREPPPPPLELSTHAGVSLWVGPLPAPAGALEAGVGLGHLPAWQLEASYVLAPSASGVGAGREGTFRLHAGMLALCRDFAGGRGARLGGCLVGLAGAVTGRAEGLGGGSGSGAGEARLPLVTTGLRARGGLHLAGPLWAELSGDVFAALVRPSFHYTVLAESTLQLEQRVLWQALPVGLRAAGRLVVVF